MRTKLCLIGYGRMGQSIETLVEKHDCIVHYIILRDLSWDIQKLKECDVAIEFSVPNSALNNILTCINNGVPVVSGTTGWLQKLGEVKSILDKNKDVAFLYGSNFSLGMNLFFRINKFTAKLLQTDASLDLTMTEIHHTQKLDKPSGTAITLAEGIIGERKDKKAWINKQSHDASIIGIESIREPDVPGTHQVIYENLIDKISISHEAKSRVGFATGAILAAKWLVDKSGYFTISDFVDDLIEHQL